MKKLLFVCAAALLPFAPVVALSAKDHTTKLATRPVLGLELARSLIAAAGAYAHEHNSPGGAIAVVDAGGHLIALERLDGTFPASSRVSIGKARTAAVFQKPTSLFENIVNQGRFTMTAIEDFTPLQGGVPITVDGVVIGAIGVSGAMSAQQDEEIALAGVAALSN